jgi:hypothetical protein
VQCSYCGTHSRIQHRTRFLERKIELPPPPPQERHMPVAEQRHGLKWILSITSFFPLLIAGAVTYFTLESTGGLKSIGNAIDQAKQAVSLQDRWSYAGDGSALLYDVNGDGNGDIIGPIRYVQNNDSYHIAAFDGQTGSKLWESERFGTHDDMIAGRTGMHGDYIVQPDSRGNISGFAVHTGERLWKVSMGEQLREMCAPGDIPDGNASHTYLALGLKDKKWKSLNLADGAFTPLEARPKDCHAIAMHVRRGQPGHQYASDSRKRKPPKLNIEGMSVKDSLELAFEPGRHLLIGQKTPGTAIPMLALIHSSELDEPDPADSNKKKRRKKSPKPRLIVDWVSELPALDPLSVKEGAPKLVAMNSNYVAAIYEPKQGNPRVVGFSREGGRRLWDTVLPDNSSYALRALDIGKTRVYVSHWGRLDAFDASNGEFVFSLGY